MPHESKPKSMLINKPIYVTLDHQKRFRAIARKYPVSSIVMEMALTYLESLKRGEPEQRVVEAFEQ